MIPEYEAGTAVTEELSVPSPGGSTLSSASSVEYAVFDEQGSEVVARQAFAGYTDGDTTVSVTVAATDTSLASGVIRGLRRIEVYFGTADGVYTATGRFKIAMPNKLVVLANSFLTYDEALLELDSMPYLDGFSAATESDQIAALIAAYLRLTRMNYKYPVNSGEQTKITDVFDPYEADAYGKLWGHVLDIANITLDDWQNYPDEFKQALRRAQLAEADVMLNGDPMGDMRESGIISETVGESKVFLRQIPSVRTAVSRAALKELRGFTFRSTRVGRG
jgi:hypothetical protein